MPHVIFTTLLTHHFDLVRLLRRRDPPRCRPRAGERAGRASCCGSVSISLELRPAARSARSWPAIATARRAPPNGWSWAARRGSIVVEDVTRRVIARRRRSRSTASRSSRIHLPAATRFTTRCVEHVQAFIEHVARRRGAAGDRPRRPGRHATGRGGHRVAARLARPIEVVQHDTRPDAANDHRLEPSASSRDTPAFPGDPPLGDPDLRLDRHAQHGRRAASELQPPGHEPALRHAHGRAVSLFSATARRSIGWCSSAASGRRCWCACPASTSAR